MASFCDLPKDVATSVLRWLDPRQLWKFRAISKSFNDLISSNYFVAQNLATIIPPIKSTIIISENPTDLDLIYLDAPVVYQAEYARLFLAQWKSMVWSSTPLNKQIPSAWLIHLTRLTDLNLNHLNLT
ncbi:hypothetical protein HDU99_006185, partial [Rhizoclosmatium hyalinum]